MFLEPYKSGLSGTGPLPMLRNNMSNQHHIPLPVELQQRRKNETQILSLMGLLPEINRVWVSIDNCLYLWNYTSPNSDFELAVKMDKDEGDFDMESVVGSKGRRGGPRNTGGSSKANKASSGATPGGGSSPSRSAAGERTGGVSSSSIAIVSVALTAPKPGIFAADVKYVLVVATTMHVALVALKLSGTALSSTRSNVAVGSRDVPRSAGVGNNTYQSISYLQTQFVIGTDNILCRKVLGTQGGRVFMCGSDANLYEMVYENADSSWSALTGSMPYRCAKVKHSGWNFSWRLSSVMPPMLRANFGFDEYMVDMCVDDARNVLYTADSYGCLSVMYLGSAGAEASYATHSFDLFEECRRFLSAGGGGSEGAPPAASFNEDARMKGLRIVSVHVVNLTESRKCHAVAILSNGVRVYLRLVNADGSTYLDDVGSTKRAATSMYPTLAIQPQQRGTLFPLGPMSTTGPGALAVAFVRAPPDKETIRKMQTEQSIQDDGFFPTVRSNDALRVHTALYCKGLLVLASEAAPTRPYSTSISMVSFAPSSSSAAGGEGDQVLALCDDTWARDLGVTAPGGSTSALASSSQHRSSLREALSVLPLEAGCAVHDIKENCSALNFGVASQMLALVQQSYTPMRQSMDDYRGVKVQSFDPELNASEVPALPCVAIAPGGRGASLGIARNALDQVPIQSELALQHVPAPTFALQRQILVLESNGLRVMQKLRPVDYLYDAIRANMHNPEGLRRILSTISNGYGSEQYCSMCVGLACGLPCDAGGNPGISVAVVGGGSYGHAQGGDPIREAALNCLVLPSMPTSVPSIRAGHILDPVTFSSNNLSDTNVQCSSVFRGFQLFLSRLLRPLWLRPVTEEVRGRSIPAQYLSVELLMSMATPLHALQEVMLRRNMFRSTILSNNRFSNNLTVSGSSSNSGSGMSLAAGSGPLANSGSASSSSKLGMGGINAANFAAMNVNQNLTADEIRSRLAQQYEDECICKLYRLLKRALQSLHLIETLLVADQEWKLPVKWSDFRDTTFRKLVISVTTHERVKMSLRKLILDSSTDQHKYTKGSLQIQGNLIPNLTRKLKSECYMYYSEGDAKWHEAEEGLASLEKVLAVSLSTVSPDVQKQAKLTIQCLVDAACHWHDLDLVDPSQLGAGERTELEAKCEQLMRLGKIGRRGVPELCMAAARNFSRNSSDALTSGGSGSSQQGMEFNGGDSLGGGGAYDHSAFGGAASSSDDKEVDDRGMYHGGSILTKAEMEKGRRAIYRTLLDCILSVRVQANAAARAASASTASISATPTANRVNSGFMENVFGVTIGAGASDFVGESAVSGSGTAAPLDVTEVEKAMLDMINESIQYLGTSPALSEEFLELLCARLYTNNGKELLLQLPHPYVRAFLEQNDMDLLYRWFSVHGFYEQATQLMYTMATATGMDGAAAGGATAETGPGGVLNIASRIEFLQKAWHSASVANSAAKYDYQAALQVAEAWLGALNGYTALLHDLESMNNRNSAHNAQCAPGQERTDYSPFINALRDEDVLSRINHSFVTQEVYQTGDGGSRDSSQSVLRAAAASAEARWLSDMLKKWCLFEEYLLLHKSMQTSYSQLPAKEIGSLWRSIIYR